MALQDLTWNGRSVLVTGGGGFIGSLVSRELVRLGARVSVIDLSPRNLRLWGLESVSFHSGDVRRVDDVSLAVRKERPDLIFHLAAESQVGAAYARPSAALDTNIRGTWNVLETCRIEDVPRVVVASSDKAYGIHRDLPYTEAHALQPSYLYDTSKACADFVAQAYARSYQLPVTICRCGNVYGPGDLNWDRIVPGVIRDVCSGRAPVLRSNGKPRRDYLYVDDAVEAYLRLGLAPKTSFFLGEAFNFGTGHPIRVGQLVEALLTELGRTDLEPEYSPGAAKEIPDQFLDSGKAEKELQWKPRTSLQEGLAKAIAWYRAYFASQDNPRIAASPPT